MDIRAKMNPAFARLDGGLFSAVHKADVGDGAERMREQGVALMSWADPFYPDPVLPEGVKRAALEAVENGFLSHYIMPVGSPALKQLIAARLEKRFGVRLDPLRNIIINPGSDVGLIFAMTPFLEPGDEVLVHDPSYPSNFLDAELLGARAVRVPTRPEDGWHLDMAEYEKRVTDRTKMVLLTNPNNPTGTCYSRQELEALAAFCVRHDLVCVCDQAFEDTVFPGNEMVCMCTLPGMWERTVTVCSTSKGMGLSGFRVGWIYADDHIMDVLYASAVNIQGATGTLAQLAVMPAFRDDSFIQGYLEKYDRRRRYAFERFNAIPGVSMELPESTFLLWVNVSGLGDSAEVCRYLVEHARVSVNDGSFYGEQGAGYLRVVAGCFLADEDCFAALDRMAEAFWALAREKGLG